VSSAPAPSSAAGVGPDELAWAIRAGTLEPVVSNAERAVGVAARRFAIAELERALLSADPGAARGLRERLAALDVSRAIIEASDAPLPPHAVHVPLVVRDHRGQERAVVRALMIAYDASGEPRGAFTLLPTAARAVTASIRAAAREETPATALERLHLVPVSPGGLGGGGIGGPCRGAARYLPALALFSGRRVRASLAITGAVVGRRVTHVDGLEAKLAAARERGLVLVAPDANGPPREGGLETVSDLASLVLRALEPGAPDVDLEAEVRTAARATESGWNGYRWPAVREVVTRVLARVPERRPELRIEVLARLAATERHLGRTDASLAAIAEAEAIAASAIARIAVPDEPRVRLARQKAMTLLQAFRVREAERSAARSVAIARRARLRGELIYSLGAVGLCALARGDAPRAVAAFREALDHTLAHRPSSAARSRAYLVEALGRAGDARAAREQYRLALEEAMDDAHRGVGGKVAWVRTSFAAALRALGEHAEVVRVLSDETVTTAIVETPLPGLLARRHLGLARLVRAKNEREREEAYALLESSPHAYDGLDAALRVTAQINVLHAARERLARGEEGTRRLAVGLAGLPRAGALGRLVARLDRAKDPAAVARALDALLGRLDPP